MIIETKFDVGDKIYIITAKRRYKREECKICNGNKKIETTKGFKLNCPQCDGLGYKKVDIDFYVVFNKTALKISEVHFSHIQSDNYKDGIHVLYYNIKKYAIAFNEKNIFATKEEAQLECDRLNKEEVK